MKKTIYSLIAFSFIALAGASLPAFSQNMDVSPSIDGIKAVNHLIIRYTDAEKGFRDAADEVKDARLKAAFAKKAEERKNYREELQNKLNALGQKVEGDSGSFEAATHRAWLNLKAAVSGKDDLAVLTAVRTGEEEAIKSYQPALGEPLPDDLRKTVQDQFEDVVQAYTWVNDEIKDRSKDRVAERKNQAEDIKDRAEDTKDRVTDRY